MLLVIANRELCRSVWHCEPYTILLFTLFGAVSMKSLVYLLQLCLLKCCCFFYTSLIVGWMFSDGKVLRFGRNCCWFLFVFKRREFVKHGASCASGGWKCVHLCFCIKTKTPYFWLFLLPFSLFPPLSLPNFLILLIFYSSVGWKWLSSHTLLLCCKIYHSFYSPRGWYSSGSTQHVRLP